MDTLEVCVESASSAKEAVQAGASRIELCCDLFSGGLTPTRGLVIATLRKCPPQFPVHVLIRPRPGDFCYDEDEVAAMLLDIEDVKQAGAAGVVIGALLPDGTIDKVTCSKLIAKARPLSITFHRAFDPFASLNAVISLGCDRLLTSGQEKSALEGAWLIADLIARAKNQLIIMPGGGITPRNISRVKQLTGAHEYHVSSSSLTDGPAKFKPSQVSMGGYLSNSEFQRRCFDATKFSAIMQNLQNN